MSHRTNQLENYALVEQYNPRTGNWLSDAKDILLRFLQDFFYQMPAGDSDLFHFEPGEDQGGTEEAETELIISDQGPINTDTVEKRPALIVSRGPFAWANTSLDQLLSLSFRSGTRTHTDLLTGSFVVNCVARQGLEAERLAVLVSKGIRIFRRNLQQAGFFQVGHLVQIGVESPAGALVSGDSDEDFINVPVTFPVFYQESWTVEQEAEILRRIQFKAYHVARRYDGSLISPDSLDDDGNPVEGADGVILHTWTFEAADEAEE